jgi:CRISPR-associated endonuclease Csn1
LKPEKPEYLVTLRDKAGKPYKSYSAGENAFVDIVEGADGRWLSNAVSSFDANRPNGASDGGTGAQNGHRLVMRVFKGDLVAVERSGRRVVMRVHRLDASANRFKLAEHNEAGNLDQRHADATDPFRWLMASYSTLKAMNAELVRVDELGRVWRVQPSRSPAAAP